VLGKRVNFEGVSWPSAWVRGRESVLATAALPGGSLSPVVARTSLHIAINGKPRPWETDTTQAFWRSFLELVSDNDEAGLLGFVRRFGDPDGKLVSDGEMHTGDWFAWESLLGPIAKAWEPEDADGISLISGDADRVEEADTWLGYQLRNLAAELSILPDPRTVDLVLRARSLRGYLQFSAASALKRRVPMRRCRTCGCWFEYARAGALYCSDRCRVTHHVQSRKA
jgi:hypothetical protein